MRVSATEAKNRFVSLSALAKREPIFVEEAGHLDTVIMSAEQFLAMQACNDKANHAARKKQFEPSLVTARCARNSKTLPLAVFDEQIKMPIALCPIATIKGKRFHALAHFAAPLPAKSLKRSLANVGSKADVLVSAVDTVISDI